nr:hypothetical protein GCM10017745_67770 [Saccharothrix mutabilis subsp. capreolus]
MADLVGWTGQPLWRPDWSTTEGLLGLALPDDYKALWTTIPAGRYGGTVLVQPPTTKGHVGDLLALSRETMVRLADGQERPYTSYPELPGLIPWPASATRWAARCSGWVSRRPERVACDRLRCGRELGAV